MGLPLITKDGIKEALLDRLGWDDPEMARRYGLASYDVLFHIAERIVQAGCSLIAESNFRREYDRDGFTALQERYRFRAIQVQCTADGAVLWQRFLKRDASGDRHPGHAWIPIVMRNSARYSRRAGTSRSTSKARCCGWTRPTSHASM